MMTIPAKIRLITLVDNRSGSPDSADTRQRQRSSVVPAHEEFYSTYSQLTDSRIRQYLRKSERDVYVGTRAALNLYLAQWGPKRAVLVAQEHQTHATLAPELRLAMQQAYVGLDAAVTVTEADSRAFRELTPVGDLSIFSIPNSVPAPAIPVASGQHKLVIAAGRLDKVKRYDLLLHAFRGVVDVAPDWCLRIYGSGPESGRLRRLVSDLGLSNHVLLMGRQTQLQAEWPKGSIAVSTSDRESFGMSIVEAMRAGLPVVSTRAPVGPTEIITDGVDGLLTPVGDQEALTAALLSLITDTSRRAEMAAAAIRRSANFDPEMVARRYTDVFAQRLAHTRRAESRRTRAHRVALAGGRAAVRTLARLRSDAEATAAQKGATYACSGLLARSGSILFQVQTRNCGALGLAELSLRDRSDRGSQRTVHLPLISLQPGSEGEPRWAATLPANTVITEGRWNVYGKDLAGEVHRLGYDFCDLRHAAFITPVERATTFSRRLPYGTDDGFLAVRSWVRKHHAECDTVEIQGGDVVFAGRWMWPHESGVVDRLVARRRQPPMAEVEGLPLPPRPGEDFRFALSADELGRRRFTRHDDWDLFVHSANMDVTTRLARLADDVIERKSVYHYPTVRCELPPTEFAEDWPVSVVSAHPFLTVDSEVSVFVRESG
jgi:glycosyltransferase involved in cell wall biosynthesis